MAEVNSGLGLPPVDGRAPKQGSTGRSGVGQQGTCWSILISKTANSMRSCHTIPALGCPSFPTPAVPGSSRRHPPWPARLRRSLGNTTGWYFTEISGVHRRRTRNPGGRGGHRLRPHEPRGGPTPFPGRAGAPGAATTVRKATTQRWWNGNTGQERNKNLSQNRGAQSALRSRHLG